MTDDFFPRDTEGLTEVVPTRTLRLRDGDHIDLRISPVTKHLGGDVLRMLAYDGSIPGPTLHVDQGSELTVHVKNDGDLETTVHWHGLRLENQYDGVPFETQPPIPIGGSYTQKITFPDAGFYWYHPHIREDYGLELGLYGTIIVEPSDPSYWPPADRHLTVTLDDLLVEDGKVAPFSRSGPTYTAMGRFGNVMLINGELGFSAEAAVGEVVRLYVVNTANTRIFNVGLDGARDQATSAETAVDTNASRFVDEVLLAPSERAVLDVLFETPGDVRWSITPRITSTTSARSRSTGSVDGRPPRRSISCARIAELSAAREQLEPRSQRPPDKVLAFWSEMPLLYGDDGTKTASETAYHDCPMHPEIAASFAGTCPKCGMKLVPASPDVPTPMPYACPMHDEIVAAWAASCPLCGMTLVRSDAPPRPRTATTRLTATATATASSGKTTCSRSTAQTNPPT